MQTSRHFFGEPETTTTTETVEVHQKAGRWWGWDLVHGTTKPGLVKVHKKLWKITILVGQFTIHKIWLTTLVKIWLRYG